MRSCGFIAVLSVLALLGCSGEMGTPLEEAPQVDPQASEIVLQAVDAGTGDILADEELAVRHLVRFPITLDESGVERVPSVEPYHIQHEISWDSLVVEVRLEAPSYHSLDTVLMVARGTTAGPITLRMTRRLGGGARPAPTPPRPAAGTQRPAPSDPAPADPDANIDRTQLRAGNRAYENGQWATATAAYLSMPTPPRRRGTYAREYAEAMMRLGASHINLGEFAGALDALETSIGFPDAPYRSHLFLGHAQCAVGRFEEGRASVARIEELAPSIPADEWGMARALATYQRANCTYQEFQRVEEALDILRVGGAAIREFEDFIGQGESLNPVPQEVTAAVEEATTRIEAIRERMRTGG